MSKLHPEDILHLGVIRERLNNLYNLRKAMGWTAKDMHESGGWSHGYIADALTVGLPWDWLWTSLHGLCESVGTVPAVSVTGFELKDTPMLALGRENPTFLGVGLLESFRQERLDRGMTQKDLDGPLGITKSGLHRIEASDNPRLSSLLRYARALDGSVRFEIKEK